MLLVLLACAPSSVKVGGPDDSAASTLPALAVDGPSAIDALFGPADYVVAWANGAAIRAEVVDASGSVVRTLADGTALVDTLTWDGRDEGGGALPVATFTLHVTLLGEGGSVLVDQALPVSTVRVGVSAGTLGGERIALLWHDAGGPGRYWNGGTTDPTFQITAIDDGLDVTPIPAPWDDLYEPPEDALGQNMPAAYAWNARPTLSLRVAGDVGDAALTPAIDGWTLTSGDVVPGGDVVFTKDDALSAGPGVVEDTLTLRWLAGDDEIGAQSVPLRMYAVLGPPTFDGEGSPYLPWLAVIDPALRAIGGVEPTDDAVIAALVAYVYEDLGLSYDTRWGASAYTEYSWNSYDDAHFDLTSFLERGRGSVVNCTDCAAILEAFASMLGAELSYTIVLDNFSLNFIQAIGSDHYTHCPFSNGSCGFSYHAVTTPDDGGTIYDATLALDGDDDPSSYPSDELMVQGIDGDEYLERLVMSGDVRYRHTQKETLQ